MTVAEREAFLADVHVAILAIDEAGRGPLAVPVWYLYEHGVVLVFLDKDSLKARLLRAAGRATLTVQSEAAPYRYVSVEGPVVVEPDQRDVLPLAIRYLGPQQGKSYAVANPADDGSAVARLTPEHWRTADYSQLLR